MVTVLVSGAEYAYSSETGKWTGPYEHLVEAFDHVAARYEPSPAQPSKSLGIAHLVIGIYGGEIVAFEPEEIVHVPGRIY